MALNLFTQGVDPALDLRDVNRVKEIVEYCNQLPVHQRHPYVGELVYTAFSGSHQDAIKKGFEAQAKRNDPLFLVPYLPIDPKDVGRDYEAVIRINSQSGKGGMAYILKADYGLDLPRSLQVEFSRIAQERMDAEGKELTSPELWALFRQSFLLDDAPITLIKQQTVPTSPDNRELVATLRRADGSTFTVEGEGNGPIDAFVDALKQAFGVEFSFIDYSEHAVGRGANATAASYVEIHDGDAVGRPGRRGAERHRHSHSALFFPARGSKVEYSTRLHPARRPGRHHRHRLPDLGTHHPLCRQARRRRCRRLHRREFARAGVDARLITCTNAASPQSLILVDGGGERTVLCRRDERLLLQPADLDRAWIVNARALHVDGFETAAATVAAGWARAAGIPVIADLDELYPGVEDLIDNIDYLIVSRDFPARLTGERNLEQALRIMKRRFGCAVTAATLGEDGVLAWDGSHFHSAARLPRRGRRHHRCRRHLSRRLHLRPAAGLAPRAPTRLRLRRRRPQLHRHRRPRRHRPRRSHRIPDGHHRPLRRRSRRRLTKSVRAIHPARNDCPNRALRAYHSSAIEIVSKRIPECAFPLRCRLPLLPLTCLVAFRPLQLRRSR